MVEVQASLAKNKRSIDISYKVNNEKNDDLFFYAIINIAYGNKLTCTFGEDDFKVKFFHLAGTNPDIVTKVFDSIERLK